MLSSDNIVVFSSVQLLSRVCVFVTPWTAAHQASVSITNSWSPPKPMPSSRWCHLTILSSVIPFSSCPQSFSALGSFQMSQLFSSGGQSIVVLEHFNFNYVWLFCILIFMYLKPPKILTLSLISKCFSFDQCIGFQNECVYSQGILWTFDEVPECPWFKGNSAQRLSSHVVSFV